MHVPWNASSEIQCSQGRMTFLRKMWTGPKSRETPIYSSHGLLYPMLQAITTGTLSHITNITIVIIITITNALTALTLRLVELDFFQAKSLSRWQTNRVPAPPHGDPACYSDKTHDIKHFLMYLLPDVVKMNR